jgi:hypothetical protein
LAKGEDDEGDQQNSRAKLEPMNFEPMNHAHLVSPACLRFYHDGATSRPRPRTGYAAECRCTRAACAGDAGTSTPMRR